MKRSVLEYLEASANSSSGFIMDYENKISYMELMLMSKRVGSALIELVAPVSPIAVLMDKSINALEAFFGIAYSGGFYTLLNPELPIKRLNQVLSVLKPLYIITDDKHLKLANDLYPNSSILNIDVLKKNEINQFRLDIIREGMIDTDPLYVNFTSGSTGVPKGVCIANRSVIDFIEVFTELFNINSSDVIANQAPLDFDVSVKDIYSALKTGASLCLVPRELFSAPVRLLDYLSDNKITTMIWAVSALCLITTLHGLDYKTPESVNKVLFSGEVMPMKHLREWMSHLPNATFVNLYGPTEITCNCTYHIIDRYKEYDNGIPIGKAFPNERVLLLDEYNQIIHEVGKPGEIAVAGTAVGLGYFNAPEITAKAFLQNPANTWYHDRIYRTGDLGCYDGERNIRFLGRKDFQIKYKGHRIELEEIDKAIMKLDGVIRVCTVFDSEKERLYSFYVGDADSKELHKKLALEVPAFMLPGKLIELSELPLTKNGKIDRKALLESRRRRHDR